MQFVQSIWFWALAGLTVPVIIHLWNVQHGKIRQVGSILFHSEAARSQAKSNRLSDWLRLILRCLIIILLVILICGPFIENKKK